ncbi:MAG: hypothetical protein H8E57_06420, partial [Candidatus Cloacimonetes bacterium]|nr:hypothetical protein [Candidatus Cloacimonadota bacterium]
MKRTLFVLIVTLLAGVLLAGTYSGGSGIPGDEYEIANLDDLEELSLTSGDWGADFIQTTNINASATSGWDGGAGFSPIGNGSTKFTGSYNGDGFIISDITMNRPSSNYQSVFGYTNGAVIQNLGLVDCSITAAGATGALSGYSSNGSVADCYSTGSITGNYMNIGGLIGGLLSGTTINDCYSTCTIIAPDEGRVGGLIGYCNGPVEDCYSTGSVTGLAGVGGLVGLHYGIITKCYSTSNVSGNSSGGLVGINNGGTVNNCYSRGNVSGTTDVGGFTGVNSGTVDKCYSTGTVSGTTKGGLIGTNNSTTTNSFWDTQASGESTSDGGTGKTTAEMKNVRTFTDVAWSAGLDSLWDFVDDPYDDTGTDDIWDIDGVTNGGYPFFTEEDPPTPVELSTFTAVYTNGSSLLEWTTQTESNNMGWNIYRSETGLEDGVQVNGHLIHGA